MLNLTLSCRYVQFRAIHSWENILLLNQPAIPFPTAPFIASYICITTTLYLKKLLEALSYRSSALSLLSVFGSSYLPGNRMTRPYHYMFFSAFQANTSLAFAITKCREEVSIRTGTITPVNASLSSVGFGTAVSITFFPSPWLGRKTTQTKQPLMIFYS